MIRLKAAEPTRMGVSVHNRSIHIQTVLHGKKSCGILLYSYHHRNKEPMQIDFPEECRIGNVWCMDMTGVNPETTYYQFHEDGKPVGDVYGRRLIGHRLFGEAHAKAKSEDRILGFAFDADRYPWGEDIRPQTPYEDSIFYMLHTRGFTMSEDSGVREKGTFLGIQRKIPYLLKLGVTGIVLQPSYEFEECVVRKIKTPYEKPMKDSRGLNYWGFLSGNYFAPKNAYSYSDNAVRELKNLVKALHKNHLEIILQFYFDESSDDNLVEEVLEYWSLNYHIDGFQLIGRSVDVSHLSSDPYLQRTKIWLHDFDLRLTEEAAKENGRQFAMISRAFQDQIRCFIKGDENMLPGVTYQLRHNAKEAAVINFLASYEGFRLKDLYSYDRKHNEDNGEQNTDGENYNNSWNCGEEGETRKRHVLNLRRKLMMNAVTCLMTSQGTPLIYMGDECGKSAKGNNNPYCQDNDISWKQWKLSKSDRAFMKFVTDLIIFRKAHGTLHLSAECNMMDYKNTGYPDLSFHGMEAWKPDMSYYVRTVAALYNGAYAPAAEDSLYIFYNMHWEPHTFAMPRLGDGKTWVKIMDTDLKDPFDCPVKKAPTSGKAPEAGKDSAAGKKEKAQPAICEEVAARSVQIYKSTKKRSV